MMNIVSFREPKFKPMPGELTPAVINGATLPVKVEAMRRAVANCTDLSELLNWKDRIGALAAAAKMSKMPDMCRDLNKFHKEAVLRLAELLDSYSDAKAPTQGMHISESVCADILARHKAGQIPSFIAKKHKIAAARVERFIKGAADLPQTSERTIAARAAGISKTDQWRLSRIAKIPAKTRESILADDTISASPRVLVRHAPGKNKITNAAVSNAASILFYGITAEEKLKRRGAAHLGIAGAAMSLRNTDISAVSQLTPEEKQRAKKLIVEMQEILDEMDRRLGA